MLLVGLQAGSYISACARTPQSQKDSAALSVCASRRSCCAAPAFGFCRFGSASSHKNTAREVPYVHPSIIGNLFVDIMKEMNLRVLMTAETPSVDWYTYLSQRGSPPSNHLHTSAFDFRRCTIIRHLFSCVPLPPPA